MKADFVSVRLQKYNDTFNKLHVPLLAITQLYVAFFRAYAAPTVNNGMGMPRSFVLLFQQFLVGSIFFFLSLFSGKSFKINPKTTPFLIMTGLIHVSISQQIFTRSQISNGPFITAGYQPIVPAISTLGAFVLKYEKANFLKYFGIIVCLGATLSRVYFDNFYDTYGGNQFVGKFYVFNQVLFLSIGVLLQKKIIANNKGVSLLVIVFYIYLWGFICSILIYNIKWFNDTYNTSSWHNTRETFNFYFSFEYLRAIFNIPGIYFTLVMCEAYRYVTLMYINRQGQISKVTLYGGLHGFYVLIIWIVFETPLYFDYIFISLITVGY